MRGLKALLKRVATETDVAWLKDKRWDVHRAADVAAFNDCTREFNRLCDAEAAIVKRVNEIEGEGSYK